MDDPLFEQHLCFGISLVDSKRWERDNGKTNEKKFTHQLNKKREEKNSSQRKTELNSVWKKMREK